MTFPLKTISIRQVTWIWYTCLILTAVPLLQLIVRIVQQDLGPNPVEFITHSTGDWALYLFCITLAISPLRQLTHWNWVIRLRRMLGLMSFLYLSVHFLAFLWFDHFFDVAEMWQDMLTRPFILVGMIAFGLMTLLAATSFNRMIRLLGGQNWKWLHRLMYVIGPLAVLHYWWAKSGKNLIFQPMVFAGIVAVLLLYRVGVRYIKRA